MERCPEVEDLARRFLDAKRHGDGAAVVALLSRDPDISWIGTEAGDWVEGYNAVAALHAATPQGITIDGSSPIAFRRGDVAWVADRLQVTFPGADSAQMRFTAVAVLEDGCWRLVQGQVSVAESPADD